MAMSEFIRNLDVSFEIVSPAKGWFYIYAKRSTTAKAIERQEQTTFFWFTGTQATPIQKVEENNAYAELTSEARDIKNQPVEFVPLLK
jgi:cell division protein FtsZ